MISQRYLNEGYEDMVLYKQDTPVTMYIVWYIVWTHGKLVYNDTHYIYSVNAYCYRPTYSTLTYIYTYLSLAIRNIPCTRNFD